MSIGTSEAQLTGVLPRAPGVGPQVRIAPRARGLLSIQRRFSSKAVLLNYSDSPAASRVGLPLPYSDRYKRVQWTPLSSVYRPRSSETA